jgi:hypothetical protein
MRFTANVVLASLIFFSFPSSAGNITFVNGQNVWHSTQCTPPQTPPSLAAANPESRAEDMNTRITQYNQFVQASQSYMYCVSAEAQRDGEAANEAIVHSGESAIADMQKTVTALGASLQSR